MKHFTWKTFAVIAVVIVGVSFVYSNYAGNKANEGVTLERHLKGNPNATVTLTEYSDFQCPACGQFYPAVKSITEDYGDQLQFEYKHFPLVTIHPFAVPAAKAAEAAAQQGKFFQMHDKLFENQTTWANSTNPQGYFEQYAEELGLDVDLFVQHMRAPSIAKAIDNSFNEARDLGLTGTPTFFLNGERMEFASFAEFRTQIEAALGVVPGDDTDISSATPDGELQAQ